VRLVTDGPDVVISASDVALDRDVTAVATRPEGAEAQDDEAMARLDAHRASLSLTVTDGADRDGRVALTETQCLALTHRLLRHLQGLCPAELVFWENTNTIFTIEEFVGLHGRRP